MFTAICDKQRIMGKNIGKEIDIVHMWLFCNLIFLNNRHSKYGALLIRIKILSTFEWAITKSNVFFEVYHDQ